MLIEAGRESEFTAEELKPLDVQQNLDGKITSFPTIEKDWHVACAYNQWGIAGMAKMIVCQTLDDMNELVRSYHNGGALSIKWFTVPDTHFVKISSFDDSKNDKQSIKSKI